MSVRTWWVIGASVMLVAAAAATALVLVRGIEGLGGPPTWDDYRVTAKGLVVRTELRPCDELTEVEVVERPRRVEVTVAVDSGGLWCGESAADRSARVRLSEPLGRRGVYDGACLAETSRVRDCLREERAVS